MVDACDNSPCRQSGRPPPKFIGLFGAGDWQLTAADYDAHGNVIRELDAGAIATVKAFLADGTNPNLSAGDLSADHLATITQYNAEQKLTAPLTLADGTVLPVGHVTHPVMRTAPPPGMRLATHLLQHSFPRSR